MKVSSKCKKYIFLFLILVLATFPKITVYKDGGSIRYKSFIYEIHQYHQMNLNGDYFEGISVRLFGYQIYRSRNE